MQPDELVGDTSSGAPRIPLSLRVHTIPAHGLRTQLSRPQIRARPRSSKSIGPMGVCKGRVSRKMRPHRACLHWVRKTAIIVMKYTDRRHKLGEDRTKGKSHAVFDYRCHLSSGPWA